MNVAAVLAATTSPNATGAGPLTVLHRYASVPDGRPSSVAAPVSVTTLVGSVIDAGCAEADTTGAVFVGGGGGGAGVTVTVTSADASNSPSVTVTRST